MAADGANGTGLGPGNTSTPQSGTSTPNPRFMTQGASAEDRLLSQTVGLVHPDEYRKRKAEVVGSGSGTAHTSGSATPDPEVRQLKRLKTKAKSKGAKKGALSFGYDDEEEATSSAGGGGEGQDTVVGKKKGPALAANSRLGFTPKNLLNKKAQREEDAEKAALRASLEAVLAKENEAVKETEFLIPYVFYGQNGKDMPGGVQRMKKGDPVWFFLDRVKRTAGRNATSAKERTDWAKLTEHDLVMVRKQMILPDHMDFLTFMKNKYAGYQSSNCQGPLFEHSSERTKHTPSEPNHAPGNASVGEDKDSGIRTSSVPTPSTPDVNHVPDEELEGYGEDPSMTKVLRKDWYNSHKHLFPVKIWEIFDPQKDYTTAVRRDQNGNRFFGV